MKHFIFALAVLANMAVAINQHANAQGGGNSIGHGGGNGGSDQEMQLTKRAQQIGHFLKSKIGSSTFNMLNPETILNTINSADFDVVDAELTDKYGVVRACINEPARALVTCNLTSILELSKKDDILTAMIFHEILGLMQIELGHQDNVSMYPISSKILPYHNVVKSTPISEAQIRPEFFGLDNKSYGLTLVNKKTKESLRLICLNDNVEIHRCRNYSLVRSAKGMQAPLSAEVISMSPAQIQMMNLEAVTPKNVREAMEELERLRAEGIKYLTLGGTVRPCGEFVCRGIRTHYRYGIGFSQLTYVVGVLTPFSVPIDTAAEAGKQLTNIITYPVKALVKGIQKLTLKREISKFNKKIELAAQVMNTKGGLSLIDTKKSVSDEEFETTLKILTVSLQTLK